jgi:membrane protein required for colicin V production
MGIWNWLDWILAAVVVVSIAAAILKGFIRELISLASVVAGLVIAALGYQRAALWFDDLTRSHNVALGLGFLTLFVGTLLVGAVVSVLARKLIQKAGLQWFDRFLGGVFGLVRGVVVDCILLMVLVAFAIKAEAVQKSTLAPYVTTGARVIALVMPADLKAEFKAGFDKFRQSLIQTDKQATGN